MKQAQDTYTQLLRADKLLNRNKYNEVLSITKKILKIDNKNADALSLAGLCYERQANKWRDKGKKQLAQQYYRKALPYFEKQTKVDSKDAVAWYNRGTILSKLDNYNAAIKIAKQALELLPKDEKAKFIGVFYDIGDGYFEIKKYKRVIETDNFVLRYTPKDVDVLVQKGGALCNIGKYKPALVAVNKALKSERNNVHAMENKAIILSKLGRNKEALLYFNRVLKIEPDRKNTLINKLLTLEDIDRFDKKLWAKVIDIEPYFYDEIKRIVKKLITEGKHREALLYLNLAIKKACERGIKN